MGLLLLTVIRMKPGFACRALCPWFGLLFLDSYRIEISLLFFGLLSGTDSLNTDRGIFYISGQVGHISCYLIALPRDFVFRRAI